MQITVQTDSRSFTNTFTPAILIVETEQGVTAHGDSSAELQAALAARQAFVFAGDLFLNRGIPMSALND